jgi:hypothetical protein
VTALSKTDKTRPWQVKIDEANARDPYGARRGGYPHAPGIWGCPDSCYMCTGWRREENRRSRRQGRRAARNWRDDW